MIASATRGSARRRRERLTPFGEPDQDAPGAGEHRGRNRDRVRPLAASGQDQHRAGWPLREHVASRHVRQCGTGLLCGQGFGRRRLSCARWDRAASTTWRGSPSSRSNAECDYPALLFEERWHTSGELFGRACRIAGALPELGVEPGERVVVTMANCPEVGIVYNALWRAGAVVTPATFLLPARGPPACDRRCSGLRGGDNARVRRQGQGGRRRAGPRPLRDLERRGG